MTVKDLKKMLSNTWKKFLFFIDSRPMVSFFGFLGVLLLLVVAGSLLRTPNTVADQKSPEPKLVETYSFGDTPKMTFTAKVEKSGVVSVFAQSAGVVQKLHLSEGKRVTRGQTIVSLSSNYQGTNIASISRQIAQKNADSATSNYDLQMDIIHRQRDVANKANIQASDLRTITRQSIDDTTALITTNQNLLNGLQAQLANDPSNTGLQQQIAGVQSALLNLRSGLRVTEYQTQDSTVSAQLGDIGRDISLRQLDLQERGVTLAKDMAELNLKLAVASESFMYPAAPVNGEIERVYVKVGQSVSPGTLIATLKADKGENTAIVLVPQSIAKQISLTELSEFLISGKKVLVAPRFVSTEATDGNLYSVLYSIPSTYADQLIHSGSLSVSIPIGSKKIVVDDLSIPLDSVYQTAEKSFVYVKKDDKAAVKEVSLGSVSGRFVKVNSGLNATDVLILSRTVQEGDSIRTE